MSKDYYHILGVEKNASAEQIKKAYRRQAKSLHPDINQSETASADFQDLIKAYTVLKQPEKRELYDAGILEQTEQHIYPDWQDIFGENNRGRWVRNEPVYAEYYYQTDYEANKRTSTLFCIATLLLSLTFFADLFLHRELGTTRIEYLVYDIDPNQRALDKDKVIIHTDLIDFKVLLANNTLVAGEEIEIRRSMLYGFLSYRRVGVSDFTYASAVHFLIYLVATIVLVSAALGASPILTAERKFNAAIIATFFSLVVIAMTLLS